MATARDIATPLLMLCRQLNNPTQQSFISFMCNAFIVTYHLQIQNDIIRDNIATSSILRSTTSCPSLCALFFVCQSKRQNSQSFPRPLATLKLLDFSFLGLLLPSLLFGWHYIYLGRSSPLDTRGSVYSQALEFACYVTWLSIDIQHLHCTLDSLN